MLKFLRAVPHKYLQMALAIESFVNLQTLTIKEICGCLKSLEVSYDLDDVDHSVGEFLLI